MKLLRPMDINVAYTQEYQLLRASFDWLFEETNGTCEDTRIIGEGKYHAEILSYDQSRIESGVERHYCGARVWIRDKDGRDVTNFKMIDEDLVFLELIEHQNGKEYFVFRKDLYGYSVMDVAAGKTVDFIPKKSFIPLGGSSLEEETFIACNAKYCKTNNLLAVDGCYWACPYEFEFYDFSEPMNPPFPLIGHTHYFYQQKGLEFVIDIKALDFTESGECVFIIEKEEKPTRETFVVDIFDEFKYQKLVSRDPA